MTPTVVITKRLTAILAVAASLTLWLLLPGSASAVPVCPGADGAVESIGKQKAAEAVMCLINAERVASGVGALAPDSRLSLAGQWHADDMVARNYFDHFAPAPAPHGVYPDNRVQGAGFPLGDGYVNENINTTAGIPSGKKVKDPTKVFDYQSTPRAAFAKWLDSPGHCYTMLLGFLTYQGVGLGKRPNGDWVWVLEVASLEWPVETPPQPNCGYNRKPTVTPLDPGLPGEKKVLTETSPRPKHCAKPRLAGVKPRRHGKVLRVKAKVGGAQRFVACQAGASASKETSALKVRLVVRQPGAKKLVRTFRIRPKNRVTAKIRLPRAKSGSVTVSIPGVKHSAQWIWFK